MRFCWLGRIRMSRERMQFSNWQRTRQWREMEQSASGSFLSLAHASGY